MRISSKILTEIAAAARAASAGPWRTQLALVVSDETGDCVCDAANGGLQGDPKALADAAYIAKLDPETAIAMINEIEHRDFLVNQLRETLLQVHNWLNQQANWPKDTPARRTALICQTAIDKALTETK